MISLLNSIVRLDLIEIKLKVPQVRTSLIDYNSLSEFEEDKLYDFIINKFGILKIGRGHYKLNDKDNYLYFAGRLKIKDNQICYIDNNSGHYYPSEVELIQIVNSLISSPHICYDIEHKFVNLDYLFCS